MKNFLLLVACLFTLTVNAQSTFPRFGITKNDDNTGRVLTYNFNNTKDVIGADTVKLNPNAFQTLVAPSTAITDSLTYTATITKSAIGDHIIFSFINTAGANHKIKFAGANFQFSAGGSSIILTTSKRGRITFMFDGTTWVEVSRMVQ